MKTSVTWLVGSAALALGLAACASFTPDAGLGVAVGITRAELNKDVVKVTNESIAATTQDRAEELLRRPLTPDSAVQVAIFKNRGLQAAFDDLGVAEAVYVKATLPPAPRFSASRLAGSFELEIERQILIGLVRARDLAAARRRGRATLPGGSVPCGRSRAAARGRDPTSVLSDGRG